MTTAIDFEDRHELEFLTIIYQTQGLSVDVEGGGSIMIKPPIAHSGTNYLLVYRPEFSTFAPLRLRFTNGQKRVRLFSGTISPQGSIIIGALHAFDVYGNSVAQDGPKLITPNACNTEFEVTSAPNIIRRVTLLAYGLDANGQPFDPDQVVDDIEFEADPEPRAREISFERGEYWRILYGIVAGSGGIRLGPRGPEPWPPVGPMFSPSPEARNVVLSILASEIAVLIDGTPAALEMRRAAIRCAREELDRLLNSLDKTTAM